MASKQEKKGNTTGSSKNNFAETLLAISKRFSLFKVFDDFLTTTIAGFMQNPQTRQSLYGEEYATTIASYNDSKIWHEFQKASLSLISEMEERADSSVGNDILGEFFEQHISNGKKGPLFTSYPECKLMASRVRLGHVFNEDREIKEEFRIIDPACGSGRMLLAFYELNGSGHEYYGIDIDRICVKMTALNLFLNGVWDSEVMCADARVSGDFVLSYNISFRPKGIFKIEQKEKSKLWQLTKDSPIVKPNDSGTPTTLD
jgi:type I restriction enzyme M protein